MPVYIFGLIDFHDQPDTAVVREVWRREELPDDDAAEETMLLYDLPAYLSPSTTNLTVIYDDTREDY